MQEVELTDNSKDCKKGGIGDKLQGSSMCTAVENCICTKTVNGGKVDWGAGQS